MGYYFEVAEGNETVAKINTNTYGASSGSLFLIGPAGTETQVGTVEVFNNGLKVTIPANVAVDGTFPCDYRIDLDTKQNVVNGRISYRNAVEQESVILSGTANVNVTNPVSITGEVPVLVKSTTTSDAVAQGKFFVVGGAITLGGALSGDRAAFRLTNPAASGKILQIVKLSIYSSVAQQIEYIENGNIGGTPTNVTPRNLNMASSNVSAATAQFTTGSSSGGTTWNNQSRVSEDSPLDIQFPPLILPPGKSIVVRGSSSSSQTTTVNAYWIEEPI